jgi:hypothetical protein
MPAPLARPFSPRRFAEPAAATLATRRPPIEPRRPRRLREP